MPTVHHHLPVAGPHTARRNRGSPLGHLTKRRTGVQLHFDELVC